MIKMKRLKPILLAVLVGCGCAFYLFKNVESKTFVENRYNAVAIQIGVFKDPDNAEAMSKTHGGVVFRDDDLYRVYYSILNKDENIDFMTRYLTDKGINYYLKNIKVDEKTLSNGREYELLMVKTNDDSKLAINEELLNMYREVI